ncbi:MAG: hypothetical protein J1F40_08425 [Prevotellaceae bacterium]|nr:hypothetical protein [Prevotellaceae bacterium]
MKKTTFLSVVALLMGAAVMTSCGGNSGGNLAEGASGDMDAYENSDVNGIEQARPQIMVIPGDQTLQNFQCLTTKKVDGRNFVMRDYQSYLLKDDRAKRIISAIQNDFNDQNFPLNDFEQTLKQLDTQEALDMADGLEKDAKTMLLTVAQPDIILELNYDTSRDKSTGSITRRNNNNNGEKNISYTLSALDAYTNKVVATMTSSNIKGESTTETIQEDIKQNMPKFQADIVKYFSDILTRGRDITVRVAVAQGCNISLSDTSIEGDTYADWIVDYIKTHTVKGAYKLQRNTNNELYFVNCRIRLVNEDGTQYGVYDWTRDLAKSLRRDLGLKVTNKAQGLGEVLLVIENQ